MTQTIKRVVGKTKDAGYQIGARRTFDTSLARAWKLITSPAGRRIWLGKTPRMSLAKGAAYNLDDGSSGEIRVIKEQSHLRLTWQPGGWAKPSLIQVRVIPSGKKAQISFHQEHLPGAAERKARGAHFQAVLDALEELI